MFDNLKKAFSGFRENVRQLSVRELTADDLEESLEELTMHLLKNNVAVEVADQITTELQERLVGVEVEKKQVETVIEETLHDILSDILKKSAYDITALQDSIREQKPYTLIFIGANGSGKTTTIAKVAQQLNNYKTVLAAGDTFRDASIEQLRHHASQLDVPCIAQEYGSDAAAVIYDAIEYARNKRLDVVLADTAGRSHSNVNLMDELRKIIRVNDPDMKMLVVDALLGNDVVNQVEQYHALDIDAVIVTKTDADTRGGAVLNIAALTEKPIAFLGTGQSYADLTPFDPDAVVEQLL